MKKVGKFIYWTPRILSILFICFLAMFSLDVFGNGYSFWETFVGLLIHNIPVFILIAVLVISWKREIVGGIAFIFAGLFYIAMLMINQPFEWYKLSWILNISGPAFLIGALFLVGWYKKKKAKVVLRKIKKRK
jgi:hypothetical protein